MGILNLPKKIMTEKEWYASKEHFDTEEHYDDYKKRKLNIFGGF